MICLIMLSAKKLEKWKLMYMVNCSSSITCNFSSQNSHSIRGARNTTRYLNKSVRAYFDAGGLTFNGILLKKKVHFLSLLHSSASFSRSNNSPIGKPQPANSHSCIQKSSLWNGSASNAIMSPATAANPSSQIQFSISSPDVTPIALVIVSEAYWVASTAES